MDEREALLHLSKEELVAIFLRRIVVPLVKPGLGVVGIHAFSARG